MMRCIAGKRAMLMLALMFGSMTTGADAATIDSVSAFLLPGFSTGNLGPIGATPAPNNDNSTVASPNAINSQVFMNTFGTIDYEFVLGNSAGTTEYRFTPSLINNSGVAWVGYHFELGFGTGATFVNSVLGDLLDFDTPEMDPSPTSSLFTILVHDLDSLLWSGGTAPAISSMAFAFAVDVPDGLAQFNPSGENRFTLRQVPVAAPTAVPEPATLLLTGAGVLGMLGRFRRRRGSSKSR